MRSLKKLSTEKEVQGVLKKKRTQDIIVLYHSLWGDGCVEAIKFAEAWATREGDETLFLVNSWDTPECFANYSITSVPSLLFTKKGRVTVKVEYSGLYDFFHRDVQQRQSRL
jgi:hypothetical protein